MKVIINSAISIDGRIATKEGKSNISSKTDIKRVHRLRTKVDAIMVGITTVLKDNPSLTARYSNKNNRQKLIRIIIDSKARIPLDSRIVQSANQIETIIAVTKKAPVKKLQQLEKKGVKIIDSNNTMDKKGGVKVNLAYVFNQLEKQGISSVLVEGGGDINWSIIKENLFDELIVTISPMIIGGKNATSLVEGEGYENIEESRKVKLMRISKEKTGEIILYYKNIKN